MTTMTREDLLILCTVARRICGRQNAMSGARSAFCGRSVLLDQKDARIMLDHATANPARREWLRASEVE